MDRKITKFLRNSFTGIILLCVVVFLILSVIMSSQTEKSVREVSNTYMSEINEQLQQKFNSIMDLRMTQLEGACKRTPPRSEEDREDVLSELRISAEVRDFASMDLLGADGELESVYGDKMYLMDPEGDLEMLEEKGYILTRGYSESREEVLILGTKADYRMEGGKTSVALLAEVPMEYLSEALYLFDSGDAGMHFHIIDSNGDFVINNAETSSDNYFSQMQMQAEVENNEDIAQFVEDLKVKMAAHEDCFVFLDCFGEKMHIYCSPISEDSDWYLVAGLPEGMIGSTIARMDKVCYGIMVGALVIIIACMSGIFFEYAKLTRRQMQALDESRREADRANNAKSEFLSSMSHDIRTPMNAIIGMTEIAMKNTNDSARMMEYLKKIKLSSKHLLGLINDVLDMSKIESSKMQLNEDTLSLRSVMDDIVNIIRPQIKEKNQHFDIFIQDIIAEDVFCDSVRLNQVLINLLSNAVKYTPEDGRIDVFMNQEPSEKGDDYVRTHLRVVDNGIGMSEEFQKKIYDTFTREVSQRNQKVTGTGLGMSITKAIVDLMGGTIELHSELDKGTEFHVIVDFKKAAVKENDMMLPEWNVLVVDDNEQLCTSAALNLEELGVHAEWTIDGSQAVEMIEEHHRRDDDYNFVLIDWKMPRMDGIETIRKIREGIGKEVPVFLVSAYDWSDVEDEVNSLIIEGFISKPLFKSTLYDRLSQYMEGHGENQEKQSEPELDLSGKRILLAEDIDINWEVAYELLSPSGLEIERAVNGKDCVEMFESSELGYYDAILMDIRMPVMDGYDATKAIRALERSDKELPIIAMTADAFSDDVQYCLDCGMNGHLAKPIDFKECTRTLQRFLK